MDKKKYFKMRLDGFILASRWLQTPMYLGLILAQTVYAYKFLLELIEIVKTAHIATELQLLLGILTLVDFTMVANLVAMVIIGGYATFVDRLTVKEGSYTPDWLEHIDPGTIKIKLASSLVGISSVHLLRSFIGIDGDAQLDQIKWQVLIHLAFVVSTFFLALSELLMAKKG